MAMDNTSLIKNLAQIVDFTESEIGIISGTFKIRQHLKKDFLLKPGRVCKSLFFIRKGLVRMYHLRDGKEITTYLACDDRFIVSSGSFLSQSPSYDYIQCIEDSVTLEISHKDMQYLYDTIPSWNIVGRKLMEETVLCLANLLGNQHHVKAKDRYLKFIKEKPLKIVQQTPVQYIASFLGIAPESLSRIRKEISQTAAIS
jgi:CRP-like cAMP-binding protein